MIYHRPHALLQPASAGFLLPVVRMPPALYGGHFTMTVHQSDGRGGVVPGTARQLADFDNLITDTGLDMIGTGTDANYCAVGTGSTAPANTDTTLVAQVATTGTTTTYVTSYNASPEYGQRTVVYRFSAGAAAGNLAEVGMKSGSSLFSRALILDGVGAPTTITVLGTEVLDVTYVLRIQPPAGDVSSTFVVAGVTYNFTARPAYVGSWQNCLGGTYVTGGALSLTAYGGSIGARASGPGGATGGGSMALNAYTPGSKTRSYVGTFGLTIANFAGGITAFALNAQAFWQFSIDSGANIPKTSAQVMTITASCSWDRV